MTTDRECVDCGGQGWTVHTTADPLPSGELGEPYQVQRGCETCEGTGILAIIEEETP